MAFLSKVLSSLTNDGRRISLAHWASHSYCVSPCGHSSGVMCVSQSSRWRRGSTEIWTLCCLRPSGTACVPRRRGTSVKGGVRPSAPQSAPRSVPRWRGWPGRICAPCDVFLQWFRWKVKESQWQLPGCRTVSPIPPSSQPQQFIFTHLFLKLSSVHKHFKLGGSACMCLCKHVVYAWTSSDILCIICLLLSTPGMCASAFLSTLVLLNVLYNYK